jgi:hypothetical protein
MTISGENQEIKKETVTEPKVEEPKVEEIKTEPLECAEIDTKCFYKKALAEKDTNLCPKTGDSERACLINLGITLTIEDEVLFCNGASECVLNKAKMQNTEAYCLDYGKLTADIKIGEARCIGEVAKRNDNFDRCLELDNGGMYSYYCAITFIKELKAVNSLGEPLCNKFIGKYQATCIGDVKTHKWQD